MRKKPVVLIYRKAFPHVFSIEFIFDQLQLALITSRNIDKYVLPRFSNSVLSRIINIFSLLSFRNKIVHITGDVHYAILGALFSNRVLTIHDLAFMQQNKGIKRSILKWFWIILPVKFAHVVTVVSESTKAEVLKYVAIDEAKIKVIPNFISDTFRPIYNLNLDKSKLNILQVGTAFNKNIESLAEALFEIPCTLTIIGKLDNQQKEILKKYKIQVINKLDLTEHELYLEYQNANLLTFISTIEGFGMPIIEAQACGLPVITSNCSAMPEVAGEAALLVDPLDVTAIKSAILAILENEILRNKLVEKGFENIKRFSKEKITKQYELLYQELENKN